MRKLVTLIITILFGSAFLQAQEFFAPKIEEAPAYIDSIGIHLRGECELSVEEIKVMEGTAIRTVQEFNNNVASLLHPLTDEEKTQFTAKEREVYKMVVHI